MRKMGVVRPFFLYTHYTLSGWCDIQHLKHDLNNEMAIGLSVCALVRSGFIRQLGRKV